MAYFFFETANLKRGNEVKPTLRALPNQTFEDGTPVDITLNVRAPKEAGSAPGGARLDYPVGTIFCSDFLALDQSKATPFYTVYDSADKQPNFHPVSTDPNFKYTSPAHKDTAMNAAYVLYTAGLHSNVEEKTEEKTKDASVVPVYTPADDSGKAKGEIKNWKEKYSGQLTDELQIFITWIRRLFHEKKVSLTNRITATSVATVFEWLYRCGENLDTICSIKRFEKALSNAGISYKDFESLTKGPHEFYLHTLNTEHEQRSQCTAVERDPKNSEDVVDALNLVRDAYANITGGLAMPITSVEVDAFTETLKKGWTLSEVIDPETIKKSSTSFTDFISDLSTGKIPVPERFAAEGASFIETLMADKKNAKPKDKDGFHVDSATWKLLVRNLHKKVNTIITGPTGCGKTQIVQRLCQQTGTELTIIQMGTITDPTEQLVGKLDLDTVTGGTVFDWAEFAKAIQKPGVILLDEVNRIPKNGENILFSCLDDTRELSAAGAKSSDKRTVKVHPDCVFFATANLGDEYTGTKDLDAALANRFMKMELDYLTQAMEQKILQTRFGIKEDDAFNIAFVAGKIRQMARKGDISSSVSTRHTLECASLVKDGFSCLESMEYIYLPVFDAGSGPNDQDSERAQIKAVIKQRITQ